jgi:hypothetical protein
VYRLEADGTATLLHTVGSEGDEPGQFTFPARMCLAANCSLLVCECGNRRVQELTGLGEAEPQHVRFISVASAWSLAVHCDLIAVSTDTGHIQLLNYTTGRTVGSISCRGTGRCQLSFSRGCSSVRFTPDGQFIIAAEYENSRLSMFRVDDGSFVQHIGVGVVSVGMKDIVFAPSGELLVTDPKYHRVCVLRADDDTLVRSWSVPDTCDDQCGGPIALALFGSQLLVLDCNSARVHVFE